MGEVLQLQNPVLTAGPGTVGDGTQFPDGSVSIPFALNPAVKPYQVATGRMLLTASTNNLFQTMQGVGANGPVTQGHTLFLRTNAPMQVRLTQNNVANIVRVAGVLLLEFDQANPLTLLEVNGAGQLEYGAWGNQ